MANENESWDIKANWELNYEKGIAKFKITLPDGTIKSARFVQGFYFDEKGKIVPQEELNHLLWLLTNLKNKPTCN
jgi:hypothetical protein